MGKFRESWIPLLKEQIDPTAIDVLIVSHTEPDHSGLIGDLIDLNEVLSRELDSSDWMALMSWKFKIPI